MSADELSLLQHNFNALQGKFVRLVTEKADLLEKLQENEHLIVELSYETETIGMTPFHTIPHRMTPFHTGLPYGWKILRVENFVQFKILPYLENFAGINSTFHVYNFRVISHPRKTRN